MQIARAATRSKLKMPTIKILSSLILLFTATGAIRGIQNKPRKGVVRGVVTNEQGKAVAKIRVSLEETGTPTASMVPPGKPTTMANSPLKTGTSAST
jgi:hypothetical protein